jgi:adenylate cyclase
LAVAGVPIARGFLSIAGLHPLRRAYSLTWNYGRIVEVTDFGHDTMATAVWQTSPFRHMLETKTRRLHRRLVGDDAVLYGFGWSAALPATNQFGVILSWTTSTAVGRSNGWSALELAAIEELSGTLALAIKGNSAPVAARDLLAAYLGGDAADRVSAGQVQRGSVSRIAAAILCADVRGFTNFAEETAPEEVTRRLNGIFDVLAIRCARRAAKSSSF